MDYHSKRKLLVEQLGGKCIICQSTVDLEFDHIDPDKKEYNIAKIWGNDDKLKTELPKCQLLCKKCHSEKTAIYLSNLNKKDIAHGTISKYMRYKCRCDSCKLAYSVWKKNLRRSKGEGNTKKSYKRIVNHGDVLYYTRGCRCDLCRKANADRVRKTRNK